MSDRPTVWVIEQGEYSDYRVVGVFSSRENAEAVAALLGKEEYGDKPTVAEWPLDPVVNELHQGLKPYRVVMAADGTAEKCEPKNEVSAYDIKSGVTIWERSTAPAYRGKGVQDCIHGIVWAKDEQHAVKVMNEKRAQMIASGEWKP